MSTKRKQKLPNQLTGEKRQCISWNLCENNSDIINDISEVMHPFISCKQTSSSSKKNKDENIDDELKLILDNCAFYIPVHKSLGPYESEWNCCLGHFSVSLLSFNNVIPDCDEFFLYFGDTPEYNMVYFEWEDNNLKAQCIKGSKQILYYMFETIIPKEALRGFHPKRIRLVKRNFKEETLQFIIDIYLLEEGLLNLKYPSEPIRPQKINSLFNYLTKFLYGLPSTDIKRSSSPEVDDINLLYIILKNLQQQKQTFVAIDVQHPGLYPQLRPYQKQAVLWMLEREHFVKIDHSESLHILYEEIQTPDGKTLFYNKYANFFVKDKPFSIPHTPGGILADEMGLGKTVEVLACLLLHPRTDITRPDFQKDKNESFSEILSLPENEEHKNTVSSVLATCGNNSSEGLKTELNNISQKSLKSSSRNSRSKSTKNIAFDHSYITNSNKNNSGRKPRKAKMKCLQKLEFGFSSDDEEEEVFSDYMESQSEDEDFALTDEKSNSKKKNKKKQNTPARTQNRKSKLYSNLFGEVNLENSDTENTVFKNSTQAISEENINIEKISNVTVIDSKNKISNAYFECVCGAKNSGKKSKQVQCNSCGSVQHALCVNYNMDGFKNAPYHCPHCLVAKPPIPSIASLIISPFSICHQWVEEIKKHVHKKALRMFVYGGVHRHGFIQPQTLASYDIVITTYETLRKEIDYVDLPHSNSDVGRRFRNPKRFMAIPSPLIAVEWWRICLDEAQMVECVTTKTAEMALRLSAINRWCVTGTPIQRGIEDLYGLLLFLGIDPVWVQVWWDRLFYEPYKHGIKDPLYKLISSVLWRTTKVDVLDQINIPEQTELVHWLTFSPVEEHFYRQQQNECTQEAIKKLTKYQLMDCHLNTLDRKTVNQLLYPLLRLRQACCHPQAVRGQFMPLNKSTMTMEELLESLTKKAKVEAEEAHRKLVCALNGLASVHIIEQEFPEAVETYREVIRSWEEHNSRIKTDDLQKLHALHNLAEILESHPENISPTLRDDQLKAQAMDLRNKYIEKVGVLVTAAEQNLYTAQQSVHLLKSQCCSDSPWWSEALNHSFRMEADDDLIAKIQNDLMSTANDKIGTIAYRFHDVPGLQFVITSQLDHMEDAREKLCSAIQRLKSNPSDDVFNNAVDCHLRPIAKSQKCVYCKIDSLFQKYEARLFLYQDEIQEIQDDDIELPNDLQLFSVGRQGHWGDSEVEKILKIILTFSRNSIGASAITEAGNNHVKLIDALKKEFRNLRSVWMAHRDQISSLDELNMATTRMRLRFSDEPKLNLANIIEECEVPQVKLKLASDRVVSQTELNRKLGQLLYLNNLAKAEHGKKGGINPEHCPICSKQFGTEWSVLQCGHCFCVPCIRILVTNYSFGGRQKALKCAICRQISNHEDISYVSTKASEDNEDDALAIIGSHSTKVEAVIRCLMKIHQNDPEAKSLVFSTWSSVLDVIGKGLTQNGITFRLLLASNKFQDNLSTFKREPDIQALLLPLHSGSKGLNIIEATHVLLVEPVLNPANELQAIGRIHRIGQTKRTFIHRFLVKGTIEERIHNLLKNVVATSKTKDEDMLTISDLKKLFEYEL